MINLVIISMSLEMNIGLEGKVKLKCLTKKGRAATRTAQRRRR